MIENLGTQMFTIQYKKILIIILISMLLQLATHTKQTDRSDWFVRVASCTELWIDLK